MVHSLALLLQQQYQQSDQQAPIYSQPVYQPTYVDNTSVWSHITDALQQSVYRVVSLLVSILPGLLALIIALAILTGIGILLSWLFRRILTAVKFDDRFARSANTTGVADWSPAHSPTALVGRVTFWGCVFLGLVIGLSAFDASYATGTALSFSFLPYFTHAIGAILILLIGNVVARFLARSILIGAVNAQLQYARFLSLGVKWLVLVLTAAMVLDHLQIGGTVVDLAFGILFGGIVLTLSLAVGLGSRDIVSRSLGRTADGKPEPAAANPTTPTRDTAEPLRHF